MNNRSNKNKTNKRSRRSGNQSIPTITTARRTERTHNVNTDKSGNSYAAPFGVPYAFPELSSAAYLWQEFRWTKFEIEFLYTGVTDPPGRIALCHSADPADFCDTIMLAYGYEGSKVATLASLDVKSSPLRYVIPSQLLGKWNHVHGPSSTTHVEAPFRWFFIMEGGPPEKPVGFVRVNYHIELRGSVPALANSLSLVGSKLLWHGQEVSDEQDPFGIRDKTRNRPGPVGGSP